MVDEIKRIIEDSLASIAADKAVRGVNIRGTEEKIDVRLEERKGKKGGIRGLIQRAGRYEGWVEPFM